MPRFGSVITAALLADVAAASWTVTSYYYVCVLHHLTASGFTATTLKVMATIPKCHLTISNQEKKKLSRYL